MAILAAIAVNEDGYPEVLGAAEGTKEDKAGWTNFFHWLRGRGLSGVRLIVGDKRMEMLEAMGEVFPDAKYQRCTVRFTQRVLRCPPLQSEAGGQDAQGDPRPREQERRP